VTEPACEHEPACVTCADTTVRMRVLAVDDARAVAVCVEEGEEEGGGVAPTAPARRTVDLGLVGTAAVGDVVVVHAGAALEREPHARPEREAHARPEREAHARPERDPRAQPAQEARAEPEQEARATRGRGPA
jgi:hydrogenase maturation factor